MIFRKTTKTHVKATQPHRGREEFNMGTVSKSCKVSNSW